MTCGTQPSVGRKCPPHLQRFEEMLPRPSRWFPRRRVPPRVHLPAKRRSRASLFGPRIAAISYADLMVCRAPLMSAFAARSIALVSWA
jgi:hypothetical protein